MTWNHRVILHEDGTFGIYEVFYNNGKPWGRTETPSVVGDTPGELIEELTRMAECIAKPILDDTIWEDEDE